MGLADLRPWHDGVRVITDAIVGAALALVSGVLGLLPSGHLSLPSAAGLGDVLAGLDSMVPILAPLQVALGLLAAVLVFMAVRLVLVVVNIVWP